VLSVGTGAIGIADAAVTVRPPQRAAAARTSLSLLIAHSSLEAPPLTHDAAECFWRHFVE